MVTIEQRQKTDRKRRERLRKRKLEQGCKQIQLMLEPEAQAILLNVKSRTGEPYVQIIHRAIIELENDLSVTSSENKTQPKITETKKIQWRGIWYSAILTSPVFIRQSPLVTDSVSPEI